MLPATADHIPAWAEMRALLWPDADPRELADELPPLLEDGENSWNWILLDDDDRPAGFVEVALRPMMDGCPTDPFPYLEALWIAPDIRMSGAARLLMETVEEQARARGHKVLGSDAELTNHGSHQWHVACGFEEIGRQVLYRKRL